MGVEMRKTFAIHFSPESFITANNEIKDIGRICIQLDDIAFPHKEWTDFGKVVVSWWVQEFRKLLSREQKKVQCKFMDGNFRFDVENTEDSHIWRILLIKEAAKADKVEEEGEIDVMQATNEVLQALNEVKELYRKEGKTDYSQNLNDFVQGFLEEREKSLTN